MSVTGVVADINRQFGAGTLVPASQLKPRTYRSTGSLALDVALGGGWSRSIIVDVVGKPSMGKTLVFEMAAVAAQRDENMPSVLFDFEQAFDAPRFESLGGNLDQLFIVRAENFVEGKPMFVEWSYDMLKVQLASQQYACIGLDSTAAMVAKAEYEIKQQKGEEAQGVAYTARAMSNGLRNIVGTGLVARSGSTIFFTSQMRDNFHGRSISGIPPKDNRTGGRALPFYASVQVEITRGDTFKGSVDYDTHTVKDVEYGHETKIRVRKNKCNAKQGRVVSLNIYTEGDVHGIDRAEELYALSTATNVVKRGGKYYTLPSGERIEGKDNFIQMLRDNVPVFNSVVAATREQLDMQQGASALPAEELTGPDDEPIPEYEDPDEALMRRMDAVEGHGSSSTQSSES